MYCARFEFNNTPHQTTAAVMGQTKEKRADHPTKRRWNGNQYTGALKKQKTSKNKSVSVPESVTVSVNETANHNTRASQSHAASHACDVRMSASSSKLKQGKPHVLFDKEESLTGFRFVDMELLIQFVQKLLCPECRKPLGENKRRY